MPWDSEHVFYVWFDALLNYYTALSYAPAPPGVGIDSQYWSMPEVPGGALQLSAIAEGAANNPISANERSPRQVVSRVWLNIFT